MKKNIFMAVVLLAVVIALGGCNYAAQTNQAPAVNSPGPLLNLPPNQNLNTPVTPPVTNLNTPVVTPPPVIVPPANVNKPKTSEVQIMNFAFTPATLSIKVGDTIKWINNDQPTHRIASNTFNSQDLNTGDSFSYTFTQAGSYDYNCAIHPSMTGKIIVTP